MKVNGENGNSITVWLSVRGMCVSPCFHEITVFVAWNCCFGEYFFIIFKDMSIRKEDIDIENPLNNLKYLLHCFLKNRLLWNAGKENWKNKEHIARLTAFYSKYQPSKVFSVISCYF